MRNEWTWARSAGEDYSLGYSKRPIIENAETPSASPVSKILSGVGIRAAKAFDAFTSFSRNALHTIENLGGSQVEEQQSTPADGKVANLMEALNRDGEGTSPRVGQAENDLINTVTRAESMRILPDKTMVFHYTTRDDVKVVTIQSPRVSDNDVRIDAAGNPIFYTLSPDGIMTRRNHENPTAITETQDGNIHDVSLAILFSMYQHTPSYNGTSEFVTVRQRLERSINGYEPINTVMAKGLSNINGEPILTCNVTIDDHPVNFFYRKRDQILFVETPAGVFGITGEGEFLQIVSRGERTLYPINEGENYDGYRQDLRRYTAYVLEGLERVNPKDFERFETPGRVNLYRNGANILLTMLQNRLYLSLARYHESGSDQRQFTRQTVANENLA